MLDIGKDPLSVRSEVDLSFLPQISALSLLFGIPSRASFVVPGSTPVISDKNSFPFSFHVTRFLNPDEFMLLSF